VNVQLRPVDAHEEAPSGMVYVPGGTFRMGSDHYYPEEAPAQSADCLRRPIQLAWRFLISAAHERSR
jgi:formylglycine-generating enzyme required for sulfatase activity